MMLAGSTSQHDPSANLISIRPDEWDRLKVVHYRIAGALDFRWWGA